jgi:ferredoxin
MFFKKTVRVVIKNQNLAIETKSGANLYQILVNEKAITPTLCKGNGQCGKCKVHISQRNQTKPNKKEQLVLARINLDAGFRLACQTTIKDDMVVDTSEITALSIPTDVYIRPVTKSETPPTPKEEPKPEPTPQPQPPVEVVTEKKRTHELLDGLLLSQYKGQLRYFLYSAAINGISQEGTIENAAGIAQHIESGVLSDYIHDVLKIKEIDRIIILSDEISSEGENLFDIASYKPFDIGAMPCELLRPLSGVSDLSLFLRLISANTNKCLIPPLDNLQYTFYLSDNGVVRIPNKSNIPLENIFEKVSVGENPVVEVSDDLKNVKAHKPFIAPDSLPLPILMRVASIMMKKKLTDNDLQILPRNQLDKSVPLDYVIKVLQNGELNSFALHRGKDTSLIVTQDMLNSLMETKKFINNAIEYTESLLGNIEELIITTPTPMQGLLDNMLELCLIPKRHENIAVHSFGDSSVKAVKLFQEQDIRTYIQKNLGGYARGE